MVQLSDLAAGGIGAALLIKEFRPNRVNSTIKVSANPMKKTTAFNCHPESTLIILHRRKAGM
jgi:hypothetical protein